MPVRLPVFILASLLVAACGGSGGSDNTVAPSPSTVSTLVGNWKATKAEFANATNQSQRVEIVSKGTSVTLALESSGTYTQKIVDPGQPGQTTTGTWTASKDVLQLQPAGRTGNTQFDMTLSGSTLTLNGGHVTFDVNLDGKDEECLAYLTLTRQ